MKGMKVSYVEQSDMQGILEFLQALCMSDRFQRAAAEGHQYWAGWPGVPQVRGMAWAVETLGLLHQEKWEGW